MGGNEWADLADQVTAWAFVPVSAPTPSGIPDRITSLLSEDVPEDPETADRLITCLYEAIPRSTIRMRGAAVDVVGRLVTVRRARAQLGGRRARAALAEGLEQFAARLGSDNHHVRAADAAAEAESAARELADSPDTAARERHARTLHTLSIALAAVNRHSAALTAVSEAVEIWRSSHEPDPLALSRALITRAQRLSDAGRLEDAYADAVLAAGYCRSLNADHAGVVDAELSDALRAVAIAAEGLALQDEALDAAQEAVAAARRLAQIQPDAGLMALLASLTAEAAYLARTRQDGAVVRARSATAVLRQAADLDHRKPSPVLADGIHLVTIALHACGELDAALEMIKESVPVAERLAASQPEYQCEHAWLLNAAGVCLANQNRKSEALDAYRAAIDVHRELPAAAAAASLNRLASPLGNAGMLGEDLALLEESIGCWQRMAPDLTVEMYSSWAVGLCAYGDCLRSRGRVDEALAQYEQYIALARRMMTCRPAWSREQLASGLDRRSGLLTEAGRTDEAIQAAEEAAAEYEKLLDTDPGRFLPRWTLLLSDVARYYWHLPGPGDHASRGRAGQLLEKLVEVNRRHLGALDSAPPDALRLFAYATVLRADYLRQAGDAGALALAEEGLAAHRALGRSHPSMPITAMVAYATSVLARCLSAGERYAEAREAGWEAFRLMRSLALTAPEGDTDGWLAVLSKLYLLQEILSSELGVTDFGLLLGVPYFQDPPDPEQAELLAELAAVHQERITILRRLADAVPESDRAELAGALLNFAKTVHDHADAGTTDRMVRAGQEAADIYLSLAQAERYGTARYGSSLTGALRALRAVAGETADTALRLEARRFVVKAYSWLADADEPQLRNRAFLTDVADGLNELADALWAAGRPQDAMLARKRAVDVYTRWTSLETGNKVETAARVRIWSADLAETLAQDGRPAEALGPARQMVRLDRDLADTEPARPDDQLRLADSLSFLAQLLWSSDRREEAADALGEALAIRRDTLGSSPSPSRRARLTAALTLYAMWMRVLDRPQEASSADDEIRVLDGADPRCLRERACALEELSHRLWALHRQDEALDLLEAALRAHREESRVDPAHAPVTAVDRLLLLIFRNGKRPGPGRLAVMAREAFAVGQQGGGLTLGSAVCLLANRLAAAGETAEALALQNLAVEALRRSASSRGAYDPASPDILLPELAAALSDQSRMLRKADRLPEALAAGLESAAVYRRLAGGEQGDDYADMFVRELTARARDHTDLGDKAGALRAVREAIDWAHAINAVTLPVLAEALRQQAFTLRRFGRPEKALLILGRAAHIYQSVAEHADTDPARPRYEAAVSLWHLAEWNWAAGRYDGYLAAMAQSLGSFGTFMQLDASRAPEAAALITSFSARLRAAGHITEALDHLPQDAQQDAWLMEITGWLVDIGVNLHWLERTEEAIAVTERALTVGRPLAGRQVPDALPGLALGQRNLGIYLYVSGRPDDALTMYGQATGSYARLCGDADSEWRPELAAAQMLMADVLWAAGRHAEAVAVNYEAADGLRQYLDLTGEDPSQLQKLADSQEKLADRQWSAQDEEHAIQSTREHVRTLERIMDLTGGAAAPAAAQPVSSALTELGHRLAETGDVDGALAATRRAVELSSQISAELGEDETAAASRAAMPWLNLGVYLARAGQAEEALQASLRAVEGYTAQERAADETNTGMSKAFRKEVIQALSNLAARYSAAERDAEAETATRAALDRNQRLRADHPEDAELWAMATRLNFRLSARLAKLGSTGPALDAIHEAIAVHTRFVVLDGKDDDAYQSDRIQLDEQLLLCLQAARAAAATGRGNDE